MSIDKELSELGMDVEGSPFSKHTLSTNIYSCKERKAYGNHCFTQERRLPSHN